MRADPTLLPVLKSQATPVVDPRVMVTRCPSMRARVHFLAARLCRIFGLDLSDEMDIRQDCWLEICAAFERYDEKKSAPTTFARGVASLWYCARARSLRTDQRRRQGEVSLDSLISDDLGPRSREIDPARWAALRLDRAALMTRLPPDLQEIACKLAEQAAADVAKDMGLHRGTIYRRMQRARSLAPEFDPARMVDDEKA